MGQHKLAWRTLACSYHEFGNIYGYVWQRAVEKLAVPNNPPKKKTRSCWTLSFSLSHSVNGWLPFSLFFYFHSLFCLLYTIFPCARTLCTSEPLLLWRLSTMMVITWNTTIIVAILSKCHRITAHPILVYWTYCVYLLWLDMLLWSLIDCVNDRFYFLLFLPKYMCGMRPTPESTFYYSLNWLCTRCFDFSFSFTCLKWIQPKRSNH